MKRREIIVEAPIMCRDERTEIPQLICYIVGYWIKIDGVSVSVSLNEMTELHSINANIKESPDFKETQRSVNEHPQFTFIKNSNELHLDSTFRETHYRSSVIEMILHFLNLKDCMITDNEQYWSTMQFFDIDSKEQSDLYWKVYSESRNMFIRQFIHKIAPSNVVDLVLNGKKKCIIEWDSNNKIFTCDVR